MIKALMLSTCVLLLGLGCSKKRIAACDDFLATYEKVAACSAIPEASRSTLDKVAKGMREQLDKIDADEAPRSLVDTLSDGCKRHKQTIIDLAAKLDCKL